MKIKTKFAISIARTAKFFLNLFGKDGTSLPGKIALKIDPRVLTDLTKDKKVIIISGTNGKTLTTAMINTILQQKYTVISNSSGSNMIQGITGALIAAKKTKRQQIAVLEVDEANIKKISPYIKIDYAVFTNIFRDQMDRFGEIYQTYKLMCDGLKNQPQTKMIINGDLPLFRTDHLPNQKIYYGFAHAYQEKVEPYYNSDGLLCPNCRSLLQYHLVTYSNLGDYACTNCDFKRPALQYQVTKLGDLQQDSSAFSVNHCDYQIPVGGLYNIYNALAAIAACSELGFSADEVRNGLNKLERKFGRQEIFMLGEKKIILNLIKNPVGFDQIVDLIQLDPSEKTIISFLNDNFADGRDISWIWDGNFEKLMEDRIKDVYVGGLRRADLKLRFAVAGAENIHELDHFDQLMEIIQQAKTKHIYILPTYTALLDLRNYLAKNNLVNKEMK